MKISYALLEMPAAELFIACKGEKVIYASFADIDDNLGCHGSFCEANNKMEIGRAGLKKYLEKKKLDGLSLEPDYSTVIALVNMINKHDNPCDSFELYGTELQKKVWRAALRVKSGQTVTYAELAKMAGYPNAVRAVANALGANEISLLIPCHRVIRSDGKIGGYRWGSEFKKKLLEKEKAPAHEGLFC